MLSLRQQELSEDSEPFELYIYIYNAVELSEPFQEAPCPVLPCDVIVIYLAEPDAEPLRNVLTAAARRDWGEAKQGGHAHTERRD